MLVYSLIYKGSTLCLNNTNIDNTMKINEPPINNMFLIFKKLKLYKLLFIQLTV